MPRALYARGVTQGTETTALLLIATILSSALEELKLHCVRHLSKRSVLPKCSLHLRSCPEFEKKVCA